MKLFLIWVFCFIITYLVSGAAMNFQVCQEAVNKGYDLHQCWFKQEPRK